MKKNIKGFTLIELLVVMAVIVLLAALLIVRFSIAQRKARDATRKSDLKEIQNALELYADDHKGLVPIYITDQPLSVLNSELSPTYISRMPEDPRAGFEYRFASSSDGKHYWLRARMENERTSISVPPWNPSECGDSYWTNCVFSYNGNVYFRLGNN